MEPTPVLLAQCINLGTKIFPAGTTCTAGTVQVPPVIVGGIVRCAQQICGPLPSLTPTADCVADPLTTKCIEASQYSLGTIINIIMGYVYPFAGIAIFLVLVAAGYDYILSWGDSEKITSAWSKITYAVIGFIILISIYAITQIVGAVFGLTLGLTQIF
ncbi:MAG: hypothetical protein WCJ70_03475 [bacterium]